MKSAKEILIKNYKAEEGSFLFFLHELDTFDKKSFFELYDCIIDLTAEKPTPKLDREISMMVYFVVSDILKKLIWHLSKDDRYKMKNYPTKNYVDYIDRLTIASDCYFEDRNLGEDSFDDGLREK
tara:strand:- start:433 stop:807 length:375 start_codon:yes stop_codon:yes gene_type:complete